MRLATVRVGEGTRLFLETSAGLIDAVEHAPGLTAVHDVGSLLRLGDQGLEALRALGDQASTSTVEADAVKLAPPVVNPPKVICIGLNYRAHAAEGGDELPDKPIVFAKFAQSLIGAGEGIIHPRVTHSLDYEGELGVVIGQPVKDVAPQQAMEAVSGYLVANDVTARDVQEADPGAQWLRGKSFDTFGPMGPYFVTRDEVSDWRELRLRTWVNGDLRQDELCGDMIFGVEELVSFLSQDLSLEPGDIILTGTPSGVGAGFTPPRWLVPGDLVEVEISGLGKLSSPIVTREESLREEE